MDKERLIQDAIRGYITCAEWLAMDDDGNCLNDANMPQSERERVAREVRAFIEHNFDDFLTWDVRRSDGESAVENFGHNLYLSRNVCGIGFQDRGMCDLGDRLDAAARKLGEDYIEF